MIGRVDIFFLNGDNSIYSEEELNPGAGNFWHGAHSASYIEGILNWIKSDIKFLYRIIPHQNYSRPLATSHNYDKTYHPLLYCFHNYYKSFNHHLLYLLYNILQN